jgi:hypothetical protein
MFIYIFILFVLQLITIFFLPFFLKKIFNFIQYKRIEKINIQNTILDKYKDL